MAVNEYKYRVLKDAGFSHLAALTLADTESTLFEGTNVAGSDLNLVEAESSALIAKAEQVIFQGGIGDSSSPTATSLAINSGIIEIDEDDHANWLVSGIFMVNLELTAVTGQVDALDGEVVVALSQGDGLLAQKLRPNVTLAEDANLSTPVDLGDALIVVKAGERFALTIPSAPRPEGSVLTYTATMFPRILL